MDGTQVLASCPRPVKDLLDELVARLRVSLGEELVGVHVYGSLVAGDFDAEISDLDLLVTVRSDVDDPRLGTLRQMHDEFARRHPGWRDRIDTSYLSLAALKTCLERESELVVISPGEPIHRTRTSPGWRMNWYGVRDHGITLVGPSPRAFIAPITHEDFLEAVRTHLRELPGRAEAAQDPASLAYLVLTACRGLLTCTEGRTESKPAAAHWAADRHPEWAAVIESALARREGRERGALGEEAGRRARAFVRVAVEEALGNERVDPS